MPNAGSGSCHFLKMSGNRLLPGIKWDELVAFGELVVAGVAGTPLSPRGANHCVTQPAAPCARRAHGSLLSRFAAHTAMAHSLGTARRDLQLHLETSGSPSLSTPLYKPCLLFWNEFSLFRRTIGSGEGGSQCDSSMGTKLLSAIHPLAHSCLIVQKPHNYLTSSAIKTSACVGVVFCLDCSNRLSVFASCCFLTAGFDKSFRVTAALLIFWLPPHSSYHYFTPVFIWPHTDSALTVTN